MEKTVVKTLTLENSVSQFIEKLSEIEHRSYSNMICTIIRRYEKICEEALPLGLKIDVLEK